MGLRDLVEQCSFVTGVAEQGDGAVHCSLAFLEGATGAFTATANGDALQTLTLTAKAPGGPLELNPERGISGAMGAVGEAELDHEPIDDAWVVRGEPGLLVAMKPELASLAELGVANVPKITLKDGELVVTFAKLVDEHATRHAVDGALALWHRIAFHGV